MNQLVRELIRPLLEQESVTALYGGGFKPPTKGHFDVVKKTLESYPEIDKLIIYVGAGVRDGIGQEQSLEIWGIYKDLLGDKVEIIPSKAPIGDIYRYVKNNPEEEVYFTIGAREGREDDMADIATRTRDIETKYPNTSVKVITTPDSGMSGTNARKAIADEEEFIKFLPDEVEEKSEIWNIIRPAVNENDPKKGTGKKPEGSKRRLYTDEDPKDTVGIKFSTRQDIVDTLNKKSFKAKSHARQSQIINLIHQRVRAAYGRAKDPDVKKRLKTGLDYIKDKKEASKKKTQRLKKEEKDYFGLNALVREIMEGPKYKIFSDMDGVLTDFDASFKKVSDGIAPRDYEKKFGKDKFWELIDGGGVGYWVGMPYMPDGETYWNYIKDYDVELLSSPSRSNTSRLGKRLWVRNNMPGVKLTLAQAYLKKNYAAPNHILIDDRKSNIDEWRAAGGIGILHTSAADTIQQLKKLGL